MASGTRYASVPSLVATSSSNTPAGFGVARFESTEAGEGGFPHRRCVSSHDPWPDNTFRFEFFPLDDGRTRLRVLCTTGTGKPFQAADGAEEA
jgi:hypothetical protein